MTQRGFLGFQISVRPFLTQRSRDNNEMIAWEAREPVPRGAPHSAPSSRNNALLGRPRRKHDMDNIKALLDACSVTTHPLAKAGLL